MKKLLIAILALTTLVCCNCGKSEQGTSEGSSSNNSTSSATSVWADGSVSAVTSEDSVDSDDGVIHFPYVPLQ